MKSKDSRTKIVIGGDKHFKESNKCTKRIREDKRT